MLTQQHQRPSAQLPSCWNWQRVRNDQWIRKTHRSIPDFLPKSADQRPSAQLPSYWNWQRGQTGPESQEDPQINSWHSLLKALAQKHRCCFGTSRGKDHLPNCQLTETGKGVRNYQKNQEDPQINSWNFLLKVPAPQARLPFWHQSQLH